MLARGWHAVVVALVLAGLVLQVWLTADAPASGSSNAVGTLQGRPLPGRLLLVISFFTIQSNIAAGIVSAQLARDPARDGTAWRALRLAALFGIAVTGVVYSTVLAAVHEPNGWKATVSNAIFHYLVPLLTVLGWLLFGPRPRISTRVVGLALLWPVLWFAYTLVHGAISAWYPYPFVDVASQGYVRVLLNVLAVTAVFAAVCGLLAWLDRRLGPAPAAP